MPRCEVVSRLPYGSEWMPSYSDRADALG